MQSWTLALIRDRRWPILNVLALGLGAAVTLAALASGVSARAVQPGEVQEFELVAAPLKWEIQPGLVVDGWGYNGQVPGPELHFHEGERVRIVLRNRLPVPTTVHWHGIDVPFEMDGVPGLSQPMVAPGEDFVYEFTATNPGTRWYHSHVDSNGQLELGLYGVAIVEPAAPEPVQYARDYTYVLDEKSLDFTPAVALGQASLPGREHGNGRGGLLDYDLFLMNGKAGEAIPPMEIAQGERIRVRLVNVGNLPHAMHLHGQSFTIVATDGNPVPPGGRFVKDTVLIGPGERYDIEIEGTNPGIWMFHCHMPNHSDNGMMTAMVFEGYALPDGGHGHSHSVPPAAALPTLSLQPLTAAPSSQPASASATAAPATAANTVSVSMVDNRYLTDPITIPVGTIVSWSNDGTNLHTASSFDGTWDTETIRPGQRGSITFTRPGEYRYYCRQHLLSGMFGTLIVR